MNPFIEEHPEWQGRTAVAEEGFEWKWYYAFQQVGDQVAEPLSTALYEGIANRDQQMGLVSLFSPPLLIERWLNRVAETDVTRHLEYVDCAREFHSDLRHFHYQMLFGDEEFSEQIMSKFAAWKQGTLYHNYKRIKPEHNAYDWFETALVRPDWVLADLIALLHPDVLPDHQTVFFDRYSTSIE